MRSPLQILEHLVAAATPFQKDPYCLAGMITR